MMPTLEAQPGTVPAAAAAHARPIHLYHVAYSERTLADIEPGFLVLDNLANERPDWYELWPIRRFLLANPLDEDALYGFFSPKFRLKTGLGAAEVRAFIERDGAASDAYLFCAQPDVGMFFRNVFLGGGTVYPGNFETTQAFLTAVGDDVDLSTLVMDSTGIVFSNFVVARPCYWRAWFYLADRLFAIGEYPGGGSLTQALNTPTTYRGGVHRKVFVAEGIASLLCSRAGLRCAAYDPFAIPWFSVFRNYRPQAIAADALKQAYRATGRQTYLDAFDRIQEAVFASIMREHA